MAKFRRNLTGTIWLLLAPLTLAQEEGVAKFDFTVFAFPELPEDLLYWGQPRVPAEITFQPYRRSEVLSYQGPRTLDFFRRNPRSGPGEAPLIRVSQVTIPPSIVSPLIVFVTSNGLEKDYLTHVVDDSPSALPRGSALVINYSGHHLRGIGADQSIDLPMRSQRLIQSSRAFDLQLALEHRGRNIPSLDERIDLDRNQRLVILLMPPARKSSPLVRWVLLSDDLPPPESDE